MAGSTRVGQFLKKRGSSQGEAASVLGISEPAFSAKANGKNAFKLCELQKLAKHYSMTSEEIIGLFF